MVYTRNQPVASDDLDISQPFLVNNTNAADDSFGVDHYQFSNLTANNGFHNKVTTPGYVSSPPTVPVAPPVTGANPVFYGFEPLDAGGVATTNLGLLQYSRGPNNAIPSPLTKLQSPSTPIILASGASTNVLDCTGIPRLIGTLYAFDTLLISNVTVTSIFWNGTAFQISASSTRLQVIAVGNVITLKNNTAVPMNIYWTLDLARVD